MRNDGFSSNGSKDYIRFFFTQLSTWNLFQEKSFFIFSRYFGWSIVILSRGRRFTFWIVCLKFITARGEVGC